MGGRNEATLKIRAQTPIACVVFSGLVGIERRMKLSDEAIRLMDATLRMPAHPHASSPQSLGGESEASYHTTV
jgi:hypothetical protein